MTTPSTTPSTTPTFPGAQLVDLGRRGQAAAVTAAQDATHALRSYAEAVSSKAPRPVDPQLLTSAGFDLAERLLGVQRAYVTAAVALLAEAGEAVTAQASAAGETLRNRTGQAGERVVDLATEATRRAAAARNGIAV